MNSVTASFGITKSLGKGSFEFVRVDASRTIEFSEGANVEEVWKEAWQQVDDEVSAKLEEIADYIGDK